MATEQNPPLVSVIVPVFNAETTIERAVRSCLDQTMPDLEVIVVDDGSTDASSQIVELLNDRRVRLVRMEANHGPGDARNRGMDESGATWVTFLDADDFFLPTRLERLLAAVEDEPPRTVAMDVFAGDKTSLAHKTGVFTIENLPGFGLSPLVSRAHVQASQALFPPGVRYGEDTAFLFMLMSVPGARLIRIPEPLYHYSYSDQSLTQDPGRFLQLANAYDFLLSRPGLPEAARHRIEALRRPLDVEHAYETAQLSLTQGDLGSFVSQVRSCPPVIRLAIERAPKSMLIRLKRAFGNRRR